MYSHHHQPHLDSLHHPNPRRRQPSSTSSTLLTPSEGSDLWMPNSTTVRGSSQTSRSIFSDGEQDEETNKGDELTEVGTVDMPKNRDDFELDEDEDQDRDRPLIDFGDDLPRSKRHEESGPTPTPGDKLRMLLRQMEAEVRNTTPAPTPVVVPTPYHARRPSESNHQTAQRPYVLDQENEADYTPIPGPSRSHWREGRRIGALPKERSYSPVTSPERRTRAVSHEGQEEEGEEVLDDSPPTPPLRITNPYLYNSRKVSDERRSQSPRISSRAAVLHASTSRSPPVPEAEPEPRRPTALESYLARVPAPVPPSAPGPSSPTRKGKERAFTPSPTPPRQQPSLSKGRGKTPRKWSVELAPDDSALFAEGIPVGQEGMELDIDIDESVEPPWAGIDTDTEGGEDESDDGRKGGMSGRTAIPRQTRPQSRSMEDGDEMDLPELPEIQASFDESEEEQEEVPPIARPSSRTRSRFSQSLSSSTSLRQPYPQPQSGAPRQVDRSPQKQSQSQSQSQSPSTSHSRSIFQSQSVSFTTAKSTSPSFRLNRSTRPVKQVQVPPVRPIFPQEPVQVGMAFTPPISTPPRKGDISIPVPGQTPKPPGAWLSASKPAQVKFKTSPSPLRHSQEDHSGDTSIHRIKLSPARPPRHTEKEEEGEGDMSITQRLVSLSKSLSLRPAPIPKPSTTLTEARLALAKAAEASAVAQMKVESTQRQWLEALGGMSSEKAVEVIRRSYSWGRWAWWISMEILLLWGVFRVTLEYAQMASNHPFDPSQGSTSLSLSVPLPTAISAFIIPGNRRGSVNFFDILEGLEVWRVLGGEEGLGTGRRWVQVPT